VRQEITCWQVMADYYSVLSSAVAKLETNVESARRALYDRARKAVMARMHAMNPPVSEDDVNAELAALEAAIARVEGNIARPVEEVLHAHRPAAHAGAAPAAGMGVLRGPARRVDAAQPAPSASAQGRVAPTVGRKSDVATQRRPSAGVWAGAIAVVALLVVGGLGYAYWQRQSTTSRENATPTSAAVTTAIPAPSVAPAPAVASSSPGSPSRAPEPRRQQAEASEATIPYILRRQLVYFRTTYPPGTIIIIKPQHSLYLVKDNGTALRYSIGIGADCDSSAALLVVERKDGGPGNTVPVTTALDRPSPPQQTRDGSPAAAPTFYLGDTPCRVGATNVVTAVGQNPSTGGYQLFADDMLDLYDRVPIGTKVVVTN
jgi:lipoprotein-anchoring transpeptidase ErfK/SrfK